MSGKRFHRSFTGLCLLAGAAVPVLFVVTQIAAAPFYPGYSFSRQSVSMLGTHFSRHPWIFNTGEILLGVLTLAAVLGLYRGFRKMTSPTLSALIGLTIACTGIMTLKAGIFPLPDPRHNSWAFLFPLTILTPFLMLIAVWERGRGRGLRIHLTLSDLLLLLLIPFTGHFERGTLQRLIAVGTMVPVGIIALFMWLELRRESSVAV
jgi:hypothetical membrane protein